MVNYGDVRKWDAEWLHGMVTVLNQRCNDLTGLTDEITDASKTNRWHGDAALAATRKLNGIRGGLEDLLSELSAMRTAVAEAADDVTALTHAISEAETLAGRYYLSISDNGTLNDEANFAFPSDDQRAAWELDRNRIKAEIADRINQIVRRANTIDNDLNTVISRCLEVGGIGSRTGDSLTAAAAAGADAGHLSVLEPPRTTPGANAGWWSTLSPTEQQAILQLHPDWINNLDGVPATIRDQANRHLIPTEYARLNAERDKLLDTLNKAKNNHSHPAALGKLQTDLAGIEAKLKALDDVGKMLQRDDHHLLVLDTRGERVKAAISIGDVDTANHVAVFTPGKGSTVNDRMMGYDNDMRELRDHVRQELRNNHREGESVAMVTWLNYEPPMDFADASIQSRAEDGAGKLTSFLNGIDASRTDDPHLTALGHSYGSLTTGLAIRGHSTGVDDMVVFGSPGIGSMDATQQALPGHAYNLRAPGDPIPMLGSSLPGMGLNPGGQFGMHQLSTDAYVAPDGTPLGASHGHSEYVNADDRYTTSEWNMANIIAGTGITH